MAFSNPLTQKNSRKKRIINDINITPFVDVLLVLLIIFMVAAPMMTSGINVDLPKGASTQIDEKVQPLVISIKSDGTIFLQEEQIKIGLVTAKLLAATNNDLSSKIYIRADHNLDYGKVMEIVKNINIAGFNQVILVTELNK